MSQIPTLTEMKSSMYEWKEILNPTNTPVSREKGFFFMSLEKVSTRGVVEREGGPMGFE